MAFGLGIRGIDCFEVVLFLVEYVHVIFALIVISLFVVKKSYRVLTICALPLLILGIVGALVLGSYEDAKLKGYDLTLPSLREALENYIETGEGDAHTIIESGKYAPLFGKHEVQFALNDLLSHAFLHLDSHNGANIPIAYNKGNDWFRATLGEPMVYTSGIYKTGNETLMQAQQYKMDYVANAIDVKAGEKILDIGCGWGPLVKHLTEKYGAKMTGVTLSKEQHKFATEVFNRDNGARVLLQDAMKLKETKGVIPAGGFDKITSLEMAEHVGIKRYDEFLGMVHSMLKDDGIFYFQVAGLRREWQYEDLVWGLFMGEHIFPGADASVPMGWVVNHLERNGFEVQRVQNLGNHYSLTLAHWLEEWNLAKTDIINKYGAKAFRRWEVFLAWSVRVARQGSSTVFMITAHKHNQEKLRVSTQQRLVPKF